MPGGASPPSLRWRGIREVAVEELETFWAVVVISIERKASVIHRFARADEILDVFVASAFQGRQLQIAQGLYAFSVGDGLLR